MRVEMSVAVIEYEKPECVAANSSSTNASVYGSSPEEHVTQANDHMPTLVFGGQHERTSRALATRDTLFARFDTVVQALSDQMHERLAQSIDHRLFELGFSAVCNELDVLAELRRQLTHEAMKTGESPPDRDHSDAEGAVAQLADQACHRFNRHPDIASQMARSPARSRSAVRHRAASWICASSSSVS